LANIVSKLSLEEVYIGENERITNARIMSLKSKHPNLIIERGKVIKSMGSVINPDTLFQVISDGR
jgi:hypothetical protein